MVAKRAPASLQRLGWRCRVCPDCLYLTWRQNLGDASSEEKCDCGVCGGAAVVCGSGRTVGAIHKSRTVGNRQTEYRRPPSTERDGGNGGHVSTCCGGSDCGDSGTRDGQQAIQISGWRDRLILFSTSPLTHSIARGTHVLPNVGAPIFPDSGACHKTCQELAVVASEGFRNAHEHRMNLRQAVPMANGTRTPQPYGIGSAFRRMLPR